MNELRQLREREPLLLTVDDYRILAEAGAFEGRPKVELIDGVIETLSPQRNWHAFVKSELGRRLGNLLEQLGLPLRAYVEATVALPPHDAPEPDIIVSERGDPEDYMQPEQVRLVVEVADTTVRFDLGRKKLLYASHAIPEYWVVTRSAVKRLWSPENGDYRSHDESPFGEMIESASIPGLSVDTDGLV